MTFSRKYKPVLQLSAFCMLSLLVVVLLTACSGQPQNAVNIRPSNAQAASEPSVSSIQPTNSNPQDLQSDNTASTPKQGAAPKRPAKKASSSAQGPAFSVQAKPATQPSQADTSASSTNAASTNTSSAAEAPAVAAAPAASSAPAPANLAVKPEVGFMAPDFNLQTLDGKTVRLSDLRGRPVVISYWASWCQPCKQELPVLNSLSQQYASSGIQIITVDAIEQDTEDKVRGIVDQLSIQLPVLLDHQDQFHNSYQQLFFPTSYFVDASGVIRFVKLGSATAEELRTQVDRLVSNNF